MEDFSTDQYSLNEPSNNKWESIKNGLISVGSVIWVLFMLWGEVFGLYHAFSKHNDGVLAIFIPPVAWYHSVEGVFWHDDFAGVDWNQQLASDFRLICGILNSTNENDLKTMSDRESVVLELSTRLKKYPPEKRDLLKAGTKEYCAYLNAVQSDFFDYFLKLHVMKSTFTYSKHTDSLLQGLSIYPGLQKETREVADSTQAAAVAMQDKFAEALSDSTRWSQFMGGFASIGDKTKAGLNKLVDLIFPEK